MVFLKPLKDLKFPDIEKLKTDGTCESQILDYKQQLLEDDKLLKQVSAFANTEGGFLIFGVKETSKGGYPKEILGINESEVNKERMEQIILSNIQPRLNVKIEVIGHQEKPPKVIVVVQIPNSYLKPHMNGRDNKFYKRYEFEALPMTEIEVSDAYKRRFAGYQEVESYISGLLRTREFTGVMIIGQIIVIPTILTRMIDTSDIKEFEWVNKLTFKPKHTYMRASPTPSANGVRCQYVSKDEDFLERLEIHRNGCVHYTSFFGQMNKEFLDFLFCIRLLHTLQFASTLYQRYNYFGDVKITCNLQGVGHSSLLLERLPIFKKPLCEKGEINISREFSTNILDSKYEYIASGIMDEIYNCYGLWKCPFFDDKGNFKESK